MSGYRSRGYRDKAGTSRLEKTSVLVLVGFESDVDQAERLIESLVLQSVVARDAWWKQYSQEIRYGWMSDWDKFVERRSFVEGFFSGASQRLRDEREVAERDATTTTPGTEIALRDRKAAVEDHLAGLGLRKGRSTGRTGYAGNNAGRQAGKSANVGTTSVGGTRRAIA